MWQILIFSKCPHPDWRPKESAWEMVPGNVEFVWKGIISVCELHRDRWWDMDIILWRADRVWKQSLSLLRCIFNRVELCRQSQLNGTLNSTLLLNLWPNSILSSWQCTILSWKSLHQLFDHYKIEIAWVTSLKSNPCSLRLCTILLCENEDENEVAFQCWGTEDWWLGTMSVLDSLTKCGSCSLRFRFGGWLDVLLLMKILLKKFNK